MLLKKVISSWLVLRLLLKTEELSIEYRHIFALILKAGTYTTALCAKTLKKPLYVLSESFKFTRMFPISQVYQ